VYGVGPLVLVAGPAVYGVRLVTAQRARGAVGAALVSLDPASAPDRLRDALARAVGDSALQLAIREAGSDTYLDTRGQRVDPDHPSPGMMVTALKAGDAVIIHDEQLKQEPELIRVTAAAANVALQHARLTAAIEEQLTLVQASRARIVEAGDAERRRLERDLHDGAQQRLVTLSLMLAMLRERSSGGDAELESLIDAASSEAREALIELRELAHGIHPAVLTESGLAGAVEALVERCPVVTTIAAVPAERYPPAVEAAAYFVVSEALANCAKHAQGATATVSIRRQGQRLLLRVDDDGPGGARLDAGSGLRGLADRVAALGGELRVVSRRGHGTHLEAEIPCQ